MQELKSNIESNNNSNLYHEFRNFFDTNSKEIGLYILQFQNNNDRIPKPIIINKNDIFELKIYFSIWDDLAWWMAWWVIRINIDFDRKIIKIWDNERYMYNMGDSECGRYIYDSTFCQNLKIFFENSDFYKERYSNCIKKYKETFADFDEKVFIETVKKFFLWKYEDKTWENLLKNLSKTS